MNWIRILCATAMLATGASAPAAPSAADAARDARAVLDRSIKSRPAQWTIDARPARRVEASLVFALGAPKVVAEEWHLYVAALQELPGQREVSSGGTPEPTRVTEPTALKQPLLHWQLPGAGGGGGDPAKRVVGCSINYKAELMSRRLRPRVPTDRAPAKPPELSADDRATFTAATKMLDFAEPAFQDWLADKGLRPATGETEVEFARRLFLHLKERSSFEFKEDLERRASRVCATMKSDCGGLTGVYVAALRANGVPARQLIGRWAQSSKKGETLYGKPWQQDHIKAEFFADNVGWVPVDVSVAVDYDKRPGSLKHFGNDDGDFIAMHVDADPTIDVPGLGQRTIRFLQAPAYFYKGRGTLDGAKAESDWVVKQVRRR